MDAVLFAKMLSDKHITDLKRLKYKYPDADIKEFVNLLKMGMYNCLLYTSPSPRDSILSRMPSSA